MRRWVACLRILGPKSRSKVDQNMPCSPVRQPESAPNSSGYPDPKLFLITDPQSNSVTPHLTNQSSPCQTLPCTLYSRKVALTGPAGAWRASRTRSDFPYWRQGGVAVEMHHASYVPTWFRLYSMQPGIITRPLMIATLVHPILRRVLTSGG
jgi:hypothetical protein